MEDVRRLSVGEEDEARVGLDDLAREGARRMIAAALEAEVEEYVGAFVEELDEDGRRLVVRNGRARERKLTVGSGTVAIKAPRVNDKRVDVETGERQRFTSRILPAYARRSPKVTEVLPVLYLHGLSTGNFGPALRDLLGEDAAGLSPASISRPTKAWQTEHEQFARRSLKFHRYAYRRGFGGSTRTAIGGSTRGLSSCSPSSPASVWAATTSLAEGTKNERVEAPQGPPGAGRRRARCEAYASSFPSGRGISEACRGI